MTSSPDDLYSEGLDAGLAKYIQDTGNLQPDARLYYYAANVAKKLMEARHGVERQLLKFLRDEYEITFDGSADDEILKLYAFRALQQRVG